MDEGWIKFFEVLEKKVDSIEEKVEILINRDNKRYGGILVVSIIITAIFQILIAYIDSSRYIKYVDKPPVSVDDIKR